MAMATPFRKLIAAKRSPNLGGYRRLGRGHGNATKMGNPYPRLGFKKGLQRDGPGVRDIPEGVGNWSISLAAPFRGK